MLLQGADRVLVSSESDLADRDTLRSQDGSRGNKHWTVELVRGRLAAGEVRPARPLRHNRGTWNVSRAGAFGVLFRPCIETGP